MELNFLKSKEIKGILDIIENQWSAKCPFLKDFAFLLTRKNRLYIASKEVGSVDFSKVRISSVGLHIGELKNGVLRVNIEGSQLVGPFAKKNVVELSDDEANSWLRGTDLPKSGDLNGFVIMKQNNDFLGSGKFKEGVILNYVSKARRLVVKDLP